MHDDAPSILIRPDDSSPWTTPETVAYQDEDHLQELLALDPSHIPGVPTEAVAVRELSTSAGPIDLCVIGPDGAITVVECKLAKNSEKRRMVVGQVIDYASAVRADGVRSFREHWAARGGTDLDDFLDPESAAALEHNITHGQINLCLAVDRIDDDLKRLIEFLNLVTVSEIKVTALQLAYARHGSTEILIPSTFGAEIAASKASPRAKGERWTWDAFVESLADPADQEIAHSLRSRLDATPTTGRHSQLWFGSRPGGGIFFHLHGERYCPFQLWQNSARQLRVFGNWRQWSKVDVEHFAALASLFGQSHLDSSKSVAAASLDLDAFWQTSLECDLLINQAYDDRGEL